MSGRTDGGFYVKGQSVVQGGADSENVVLFASGSLTEQYPVVLWTFANLLNAAKCLPEVTVPAGRTKRAAENLRATRAAR